VRFTASLRVVFVGALALPTAGCVEILEGNIRAVETLADGDSTVRDKGIATAVVAGTLTVAVGLGVAAAVAATTDWTPDDPPPSDYMSTELGWNVETKGDEVTWMRCTSRIFCTEERVTVDAKDVVSKARVGRTVPVAMGGGTLPEVDLFQLEIHRHR
jgi:hypothetical protein